MPNLLAHWEVTICMFLTIGDSLISDTSAVPGWLELTATWVTYQKYWHPPENKILVTTLHFGLL
jgi:hypothetical protein